MKRLLLIVLIVGIAALGGWYWLAHHGTGEMVEETKPAARVEVAPLKRQIIAQTLEAFGVVANAPSGEQVIAAPFDCIVRRIHVSAGLPVAAGDVLIEVDPSPEARLQLDAGRGVLALAAKALAATQERFDLKLANSQDLLAAQQAEQDARLKVASLETRGLGGEGRFTATAPGVVGKLDVSAGALVPAGTVLVSVSTNQGLEVRLGLEAGELASVRPGQTVQLQSANRRDAATVGSTIRAVGGAVDATTGAAEIRVPVPAGAPLLLGEHVKAAIVVLQREGLVAARSAVLPDNDRQILFTVKDGRAIRHEVKVGIVSGEGLELLGDGLQAGDAVVTLGNYELSDGMAVQMPEPAKPGTGATDRPAEETKP